MKINRTGAIFITLTTPFKRTLSMHQADVSSLLDEGFQMVTVRLVFCTEGDVKEGISAAKMPWTVVTIYHPCLWLCIHRVSCCSSQKHGYFYGAINQNLLQQKEISAG